MKPIAYTKNKLTLRIEALEIRIKQKGLSRKELKALNLSVLQCDAVLKIMNNRLVGIDELLRLPPICDHKLILTLSKQLQKFDPSEEGFRDIVSLINKHEELIVKGKKKMKRKKKKPNIFIVHGRDLATMREVRDFIQNNLRLGNAIVLRDQRSGGKTIIEKFEEYANQANLAIIILTPDDRLGTPTETNSEKRRARQNVIFELGFFYGKKRRMSGNVVLLYKGEIELPSDISGICYIDISSGVESAGEQIRKELAKWL